MDIRIVQEQLGHKDVKTTMIYTQVLNRGPVYAVLLMRDGTAAVWTDPNATVTGRGTASSTVETANGDDSNTADVLADGAFSVVAI